MKVIVFTFMFIIMAMSTSFALDNGAYLVITNEMKEVRGFRISGGGGAIVSVIIFPDMPSCNEAANYIKNTTKAECREIKKVKNYLKK